MTTATTVPYKTITNDTLKSIAQTQTGGSITPLEIYNKNKSVLGTFDENKVIPVNMNLTVPNVQKGYFIDHSAASGTATPRTSSTSPDVPLFYRDYAPNPKALPRHLKQQ